MKHYIPFSRPDTGISQVETVVERLGVDGLLSVLRQLPPEKEFPILLEFLVEFAGGLELTEHRMMEMLVEQAAISYKAYTEAVKKIKTRIAELYHYRTLEEEDNGIGK